jgi:hypothetical protein
MDGSNSVRRYLEALFDAAPQDAYVELRSRAARGMACTYWPASQLGAVAREIDARSANTDVYVGVLPRRRRGGSRDDVVDEGSVVWVDCDSAQSARALDQIVPRPSMTVASGTASNMHAYWLLRDSIPFDEIERANRQLAQLLGGDARCTDAARILRPPSLNHKHVPPTPVRLIECDPLRRWYLDDIVDSSPVARAHEPRDTKSRLAQCDELLGVDAAHYIERLTGLDVGRDRKVRCPFHEDRSPSLHAYRDPKRGWYCFGCGRGGSVYDFAALLWGCDTRGDDFLALRDRLSATLFPTSTGGARR